jgi:hypothetical protein
MPDWWATSDALRDVLVETGRLPQPQRTFRFDEIRPGWLVYDNDLERIGRVVGHDDGYLVIARRLWRFYLPLRLYVPPQGLRETHEGVVLLTVPRTWLGRMGWDRAPRRPPRRPDRPSGAGHSGRWSNFLRHRA